MKNLIIKNEAELRKAKESLINMPVIAYDTETTGLKWYKSKVFMNQFSDGATNYVIRNTNFKPGVLNKFLGDILGDKNKTIIGHNIKFDMHHLKQTHGVEIQGKIVDTMVMSHLMDENTSTALKNRCHKVLGIRPDERDYVFEWLKDNLGADRKKWDFSLVPPEIMDPYAGNDPGLCMKLYEHYKPSIDAQFKDLFETEMGIIRILYKMEKNGLPLDVPYLKSYQAILEEKQEMNKKNVFTIFGSDFDINSPMDVAEVLYKKMKLPVPKMNVSGSSSTDDEALEQIDHPVARGIQEHRHISKMLTTYVIPFQEQCVDGLLHPDYSSTRTKTGRFSCSDPNAQNITNDIDLRRAFITDPGEQMWFWDQSQIEMVGFAMYSKDEKMCKALKDGVDLHAMTAKEVLGKEDVTKEERGMGKGTNFAMVYCVGKAKLARYLSSYAGKTITDAEAADFKQKYLAAFPTVYNFQRLVINTAQKYRNPYGNFVKNKFGRVRRVDPNKAYTAVNHLIQGWAADTMKAAMVRIDKKYNPKWRQNIHDSIRIDLPSGEQTEFVRDISFLLTDFPDVGLPIRCTVDTSRTNWAEVEEVK